MWGLNKWKSCWRKFIRQIKLIPVRMYYGAGTMNKYFHIKKKYENMETDVQNNRNMTEDEKKILRRKYRVLVQKYGQLVTRTSWRREKAAEEMMLKKAILWGEKNFPNEYRREVEYCRSRKNLMLYPYSFIEGYEKEQEALPVYKMGDKQVMLKYVLHNGKKLFFPDQKDDSIRRQYIQLVMEQNEKSPHKYFSDEKLLGGVIYLLMLAVPKALYRWRLSIWPVRCIWLRVQKNGFMRWKPPLGAIKKRFI